MIADSYLDISVSKIDLRPLLELIDFFVEVCSLVASASPLDHLIISLLLLIKLNICKFIFPIKGNKVVVSVEMSVVGGHIWVVSGGGGHLSTDRAD